MSPTAQESSALSTPTTPIQLTKVQRKDLKKLEENERNRKRIKLANIEQMNKQICCSAKKGRSIIVEDDNMKPTFSVREYVKVADDTSPGIKSAGKFWFHCQSSWI